ncbi:MAG: hypothetical protein LBT84_03955 [Spirochaetia bacterium]|jgi:hypothetical protein|nr:hypothetical protein [Spirochaetia bacterium]
MEQKRISELLLNLHHAITGTNLTLNEIIDNYTIDPNISFVHETELSGKVATGRTVPIEDYYTIEDKLDYGPSGNTQ